jgi:hypothetical protein
MGQATAAGLHQALFVAQICNLLYRRIAFGGPFEFSRAWKSPKSRGS